MKKIIYTFLNHHTHTIHCLLYLHTNCLCHNKLTLYFNFFLYKYKRFYSCIYCSNIQKKNEYIRKIKKKDKVKKKIEKRKL